MKPKTLGALMSVVAVLAAVVRLRRGNVDSGVLWQCVLSFVAVVAATLPVPADATRLVRSLRTASLVAFIASLGAAPYVRLPVFAPLLAGSLILFVTWLAVERSGPRMTWLLAAFVLLAGWGALTAKKVVERRRLSALGPTDLKEVRLVAPDGHVLLLEKSDDILLVVNLFHEMKDFDPDDDALRDAWTGEMVTRDGRRQSLAIGHGNQRDATWIVVGGTSYWADEAYDDVVKPWGP